MLTTKIQTLLKDTDIDASVRPIKGVLTTEQAQEFHSRHGGVFLYRPNMGYGEAWFYSDTLHLGSGVVRIGTQELMPAWVQFVIDGKNVDIQTFQHFWRLDPSKQYTTIKMLATYATVDA